MAYVFPIRMPEKKLRKHIVDTHLLPGMASLRSDLNPFFRLWQFPSQAKIGLAKLSHVWHSENLISKDLGLDLTSKCTGLAFALKVL